MATVETHAIPGMLARHVSYLAACKGCGKEADWPVTTKRDAERELRYDGWDVIAGWWMCADCRRAWRRVAAGGWSPPGAKGASDGKDH